MPGDLAVRVSGRVDLLVSEDGGAFLVPAALSPVAGAVAVAVTLFAVPGCDAGFVAEEIGVAFAAGSIAPILRAGAVAQDAAIDTTDNNAILPRIFIAATSHCLPDRTMSMLE